MDFSLTDEQTAIRDNVAKLCAGFDDDYWLARDDSGDFPDDFHKAMADAGWLGVAMPEEYGGANLGVTEAAILMHTVANSSGAMSAASAIHINIFGPHPIVVFGSGEQKARWLPDLIQGKTLTCFGVTEPDAGLNTSRIKTRAERSGNGYVVNGKKIWTTTAQEAGKIMLLARTTPIEDCDKPIDGLSLFYTDLDRKYCDIREIPKMGRKAVDSNEVFIDGLPVPLDQNALQRAVRYAKDRVVFDRPIGANQAIQHPLAENWCELEAAWLMAMQAAALYDRGEPCGAQANAAKYLGGEAGFNACQQAVMTHGGMGYAKEFHVERLMREVMICRIAPVSPQLILNYIAERVLGLPRSY
jgi:acyl-CoA dehydrogenase